MIPASASPRLAARGLAAGYPGRRVIDGLDLEIAPGRITMIIGANASGKSTLLGTLARLHTPLAGRVEVDDVDVRSVPRRRFAQTVGLLPQHPTAPDGVTVSELVGRGRHPHRGLLARWSAEDSARVDEAMAWTGVTDLAARPVGDLSGGQRQRVWIAMALAQDPRILLLDEPTTFLDLSHQLDVLDLLRELNRSRGTTVVAVLHDLNLAARYADELVVMHDGAVVAHGTPADVLTAEVVQTAFGLRALVMPDPLTATPLIIPVPAASGAPVAADAAPSERP
ncbi:MULTISPECIES: ABC transporter ATP-binding protein [Microbacterium]|uniref:Cobalamin/Fe(3+)-siderophore ABC transporter ATP-binding protein n=1 Tax=Microbacterium hominis TaxID=162426 RepID=A0A2K9DZ98_9MICO|nr:cobalamin/Fe(3+)-siderophore ABC transporter ATP-binding protein [Microbacterium hominis]QOC25688.1 ABC transporter ATP-binding protein [Microbacterium hominis]QOC29683.1 ABC transporter ATP-binding protein [Microbacterium hominis]QYF97938.1 ABC transporter ATP-binding protein [Microbacterium sp. PAMC21962]